jgi:hypothetical protein
VNVLKVYTKVELSDSVDYYQASDEFDYKCSIDVHAWEFYDEECDISHPNWTEFNENWDVVSTISGIVKDGKAEILVQYKIDDYELHKLNLLIQKAVKEGMKLIRGDLDYYFSD